MHPDLSQINLAIRVINFLADVYSRLKKPAPDKMKDLKIGILRYLADRKQWTSPRLIWADVVLSPILQDVTFSQAFPPKVTGWPLFRWKLENLGVNVRHRWRKWKCFIPKETVHKAILQLWHDGKLTRRRDTELYQ